LHHELYGRLPESYRVLRLAGAGEAEVVPGAFRDRDVEVGAHVAPDHRAVPVLLARFREIYGLRSRGGLEQVVAVAAAHHRLLWIHPFLDGNGRVVRLASHAFLGRAGVAGGGLWSIARGLARRRSEYLAALAAADEPRRGDLDGRGNLTAAGLSDFCTFFLGTALDQVRFMAGLLDLPGLSARVLAYAERRAAYGELRPRAGLLLREALLRGEVPRGDAPRVSGLRERTARKLVADLVAEGLLESATPKGPLRLAITADAAPWYFPQLYPPAVEQS
jgi:Fic family protein